MSTWTNWLGLGTNPAVEAKPPIDPRGYFPDTEKAVAIKFEGFDDSFSFGRADEPIWGMVFQAMVFVTGTVAAANSPAEACRQFEVVSWDSEARLLTVKLNR